MASVTSVSRSQCRCVCLAKVRDWLPWELACGSSRAGALAIGTSGCRCTTELSRTPVSICASGCRGSAAQTSADTSRCRCTSVLHRAQTPTDTTSRGCRCTSVLHRAQTPSRKYSLNAHLAASAPYKSARIAHPGGRVTSNAVEATRRFLRRKGLAGGYAEGVTLRAPVGQEACVPVVDRDGSV
jgi:hypothetical protein